MKAGLPLIRVAAVLALALLAKASASQNPLAVELRDGVVEVRGVAPSRLEAIEAGTLSGADVLIVSVRSGGVAVLGDYAVSGDVLKFEPMFPFDRGRIYAVRVLDGLGLETTVGSDPAPRARETRVDAVYPSSALLPENQLKFYVRFSDEMAGGDGLRHVRLLEEDGTEVVDPFLPLGDAFWDRDRRRYTIFFDPGRVKQGILPNEQLGRPIREGRRYALVIESSFRDASGTELAAGYRKEFRVGPADESAVDPELWTLTEPRAGTRDPLHVDFPEPMDHGILSRALRVDGVPGDVSISDDETRWSLVPDDPWVAREHRLLALTILEDLAGNQIGRPFEVDLFERIDSPESAAESYELRFVIAEPR